MLNNFQLPIPFETRPWEPIPIGFQAAVSGPILYPPRTELGRKNPTRVAMYAPNNFSETMEDVVESRARGAVSVHIHPIEERTGRHLKTPQLYAKNAAGARDAVPGIVINNDASLNGVGLDRNCSLAEYLETRLAGLINDSPPGCFYIICYK